MEKNKIFIVVDNLELRDGDKVKAFCELFFDAEKALRFVIENQKNSHQLEVLTFDVPDYNENINKEEPTQIPFTTPNPVITPNTPYPWSYPYVGDYPPQVWYGSDGIKYKTFTTTGGTGDIKVYQPEETSCTIQFSKN